MALIEVVMPQRSAQGLKVVLDREYECAGCGTRYQYRFKVRTSEPTDREAAESEALADAAKTVHNVPCPDCGRVDAQASEARRRTHVMVFAIPLIGAGIGALVACGIYPLRAKGAWIAALSVTAAAVLFIVFLLARHQPRKASRDRIEELLEEERVHSIRSGDEPAHPPADIARSAFVRLALWPILGAIVSVVIGLAVPHVGSSYNPDAIPGHVAPGQRVEIELPDQLETLNQYWRGQPELTLLNPDDLGGPVGLVGTGSDSTWPEMIPEKKNESSPFHPTVTVLIPGEQRLAHKTLSVRVRMEVTYPERAGHDAVGRPVYRVKQRLIDTVVPVPITDTNTAASLLIVWWSSAVFAALCVAVPAVVFVWLCRKSFRDLPPPVFTVVRRPEPPERADRPG